MTKLNGLLFTICLLMPAICFAQVHKGNLAAVESADDYRQFQLISEDLVVYLEVLPDRSDPACRAQVLLQQEVSNGEKLHSVLDNSDRTRIILIGQFDAGIHGASLLFTLNPLFKSSSMRREQCNTRIQFYDSEKQPVGKPIRVVDGNPPTVPIPFQ
jgi:hypothetical protein